MSERQLVDVARLDDHIQVPPLLLQQSEVSQGIAPDGDQIRNRARLYDSEPVSLTHNLGIDDQQLGLSAHCQIAPS